MAFQNRRGLGSQEQNSSFPTFEDPLVPKRDTVYEEKTASLRSQKNVERLVKPHKPVSSSTLARWLKSLLEKADIDTGIFKAHSVMGAATSAAANAGVTMADVS